MKYIIKSNQDNNKHLAKGNYLMNNFLEWAYYYGQWTIDFDSKEEAQKLIDKNNINGFVSGM